MQKIELALEPEIERRKEKPKAISVVAKEKEYDQEQEKFLNERVQIEYVKEKVQRLVPQYDLRKLIL